MSDGAMQVKCPTCGGARTITFDHIEGRVEGYCPQCTTLIHPPRNVQLAEIERLQAQNKALVEQLNRAIETRENANAVSLRLEAELDQYHEALRTVMRILKDAANPGGTHG